MNSFLSNFIFLLEEKYFGSSSGFVLEISDEQYFAFCRDYLECSKQRDIDVKNHLISSPNAFRTFLPYRENIFSTVFELQWYYDEIIIFDPIVFEIKYWKTGSLKKDKNRLISLLQFLNRIKDSIKSGFIIFASYDSFGSEKALDNIQINDLLTIPEIRKQCDELISVYKMESPTSKEQGYFNIRTKYVNKETLFAVINDPDKIKINGLYGITFDFVGSKHIPLSLKEIQEAGIYNRTFETYTKDYKFEIAEVLSYVDIGLELNTPILFNRQLDKSILKNISNKSSVSNLANDYYRLFLPFIKGVSPEKLMEVRLRMPTAFQDFRDQMFEIIYDAERNYDDPSIIEIKIRQKINPAVKKLDNEMKNVVTKNRIIGAGLPIISGVGALGLLYFGIDISKYIPLLVGGVPIAELTLYANSINEKRGVQSNSLYYLWEVTK